MYNDDETRAIIINFCKKNIDLHQNMIDSMQKTIKQDHPKQEPVQDPDQFCNQTAIWDRMQAARNANIEKKEKEPPLITNLHRFNSTERSVLLSNIFKKATKNVNAIIDANKLSDPLCVITEIDKHKKIQDEADKLLAVFLQL